MCEMMFWDFSAQIISTWGRGNFCWHSWWWLQYCLGSWRNWFGIFLLQASFSWTFILFVPLVQCKRFCYCNMCSNTVHYYINSVNTNGDGSSNCSINNMSGMWTAFSDIQEESLNRGFPPFFSFLCRRNAEISLWVGIWGIPGEQQ